MLYIRHIRSMLLRNNYHKYIGNIDWQSSAGPLFSPGLACSERRRPALLRRFPAGRDETYRRACIAFDMALSARLGSKSGSSAKLFTLLKLLNSWGSRLLAPTLNKEQPYHSAVLSLRP